MIRSKNDLRHYLTEDLRRFNGRKPGLKDGLLHNESWYIYHYLQHLRYVEYYNNTGKSKIMFLWHFFCYKRLGFKLHFTIYPNTVGEGFHIYHVGGFTYVGPKTSIGNNCTLEPAVVFGNKHEDENEDRIIVGDNCYFGLGAKIFGPVKIGNNVTVGANAVITKDVPDNAVVGGVPAKIIRIKKA